ncbi:GT99 family glycosyltransferase N-terminal domain-containing protein [Acetobacter senegalensis]|uniref:GT99 family glycosyltransferase N-terminal domain-containing protein n=1 Tax=Acetobacter senegalensis TaxID=446692 RepID=UPI00264E13F1|nr:hypothetical protein [Acetobacter senegalensis]MDN7352372.1 hypothetical protein [Acetobacter senegalensis]
MTHHFVFVIPPVSPVGALPHYFWVLQKWLYEFKDEETSVIMPSYYQDAFLDQNRWEFSEWSKDFHQYETTSLKKDYYKNIYYYPHIHEIDNNHSIIERFKFSVMENCHDLYVFYRNTINCIRKKFGDSLVLVSWVNNSSLRKAAETENVDLIFNEIGPLRKPYYKQTAYWDTHGVNGQTNVYSLWTCEKMAFIKWLQHHAYYSPELIQSLIANVSFMHSLPQYPLGVALQIETDSNALIFSRGWNNLSLIEYAHTYSDLNNILVRYHPNGKALYCGIADREKKPLAFLSNIKELWTINSSLGIESVFWNIPVKFFGSTPIETFVALDKNEKKNFYIWFFLRYLIPYNFLFSKEYYIWRLKKPHFSEIIDWHIKAYEEKNTNTPAIVIENKNYPTPMRIQSLEAIFSDLENYEKQKNLLQELSCSLNALKSQVSDRDAWILDRDSWIQDRDKWIKERDDLISTLKQQISDRDSWIKERDEIISTIHRTRT